MKKISRKILSVLLVIAMLVPTGSLMVQTSAEGNDFDNSEWTFQGSAYYDSENEYCVLTPNKTWMCGSIWFSSEITSDFELSFDYYSGDNALGADGIDVIFYNNDTQRGLYSDIIGYSVEIDTFYNDIDPIESNHISINKSRANHLSTLELTECEDGLWHNLKIIVKDNVCSVYVDNDFKVSCTTNVTGYGYLGIVGDTGGKRNLHAVKNIEIKTGVDMSGEHYISGMVTGGSSAHRISIDGTWYNYDTSVPGLKDAIEKFPINGTISCKIKNGKIIACSECEIKNTATLSVNTTSNNIQYNSETKKYDPEKISLNVNIANNICGVKGSKIDTAYIAGYDITFDKLEINIYGEDMLVHGEKMLYFKDGWFGLGKTYEIEKNFDTPVTLSTGETFNFSEDLTAYANDNYKWENDELKKENEICVYAYNGDTLVAGDTLTVTFNNKTAEASVKNKADLDKKIQNAANLLEKTTGVIHSPYLEELLTKEGLQEATNALKCKVALSSTILKAKKNETLEDKLIDKLMKKAGISKEWMGTVYTTDIVHSVSANTKEHGKFEVEFNIKLTNVSIGTGNPYAGFSFETTYNIKGGKNIKERTGSVTSYFGYADIQTFADSVEEVALEQIEYAYDLGYGDDLNEVCEMFFDDTITSILSKTKAESYSHLFYESLIYPTKQMNVHCPVDIYIYNAEGVLCASVENNEVTMTCEDIDIEVIGDEKYLTIYDGDYSVEIIATAIDDMDVEIKEYSSKDKLFRTATFNDIALYPGDSFMTNVDENYLDSKYELVKNEEDVIVPDNDESSIHYLDEIKIIDKEATCIEDGKYHIECKECKVTVLTEIIPATGHLDENHDGICDTCSEDFTKSCSCSCHSNAFMQFIHKILCFLYRIFGMEQYRYCGCGKAHW